MHLQEIIYPGIFAGPLTFLFYLFFLFGGGICCRTGGRTAMVEFDRSVWWGTRGYSLVLYCTRSVAWVASCWLVWYSKSKLRSTVGLRVVLYFCIFFPIMEILFLTA